tara:strand:+ start:204 stop:632 length:429 start_codon:yes stop_codon:yes gene_type:complete
MQEKDKISFKSMMDTLASVYQKQALDQDTLRVWFYKLEKFEFSIVTKAFNKHIDNSKFFPSIFDILQLCREKPIEFARLEAPKLSKEANAVYAANVNRFVQDNMIEEKKLKDMRAWAHRIIANPKNYPSISLEFAKEAIHAK